MSAGTLTLTNNSATVTGSGTAFSTELAAGDFIVVTVGGVPYTLPVKTVNSNTSLTLVSNYTGPTQSGAAWSSVPRVALNMVTAALVAQSAEALRGLNYDKQNWQSIFSGTGDVTVKLPDGTTFTGPAWGGIVTSLNGKLDKNLVTGQVSNGAVIETGSNDNGVYTKFADGTMISSGVVTCTSATQQITFPATFNSIPAVILSPRGNAGFWSFMGLQPGTPLTTRFTAYAYTDFAGGQGDLTGKTINWYANGRWK